MQDFPCQWAYNLCKKVSKSDFFLIKATKDKVAKNLALLILLFSTFKPYHKPFHRNSRLPCFSMELTE